jgi:RNA polymerase sigma-70 factor, ECF subfamily
MRTIFKKPWFFSQVVYVRHATDEIGNVTLLLNQVRQGQADAFDRLTRAIYEELHKMAHSRMSKERSGHVLQTTALLNESIVRLLDGNVPARAPNRRYLFAAASRAMRAILVDHGRRRRRERRSTIDDSSFLDDVLVMIERDGAPIEELNRALEELKQINRRQQQVVDMRFFGGFSVLATGAELGVSRSTVESDSRIACAWLRARLDGLI